MLSNTSFSGRSCLITGAGSPSGIGFATAKILGQMGGKIAMVSTTDRIQTRANELREFGIEAQGYVADLTNRSQVQALIESVIRDWGSIDVLVNNAGMTQVGSNEKFVEFADLSFEDWESSLARNLSTTFHVTRLVLPFMVNNGYGRVVNVSSVTGPIVSNPGESAYSAAKAAMVGMSRAIALEVARHNIVVNNVAPGWIATGSQTELEMIAGQNTPDGALRQRG